MSAAANQAIRLERRAQLSQKFRICDNALQHVEMWITLRAAHLVTAS
jgi:hypothetical protein